MIRRPPRSTRVRSSAASDVYKRQAGKHVTLVFKSAVQTDKKLAQYRKVAFLHPVPIVVKTDDKIGNFQTLTGIIPSNPNQGKYLIGDPLPKLYRIFGTASEY